MKKKLKWVPSNPITHPVGTRNKKKEHHDVRPYREEATGPRILPFESTTQMNDINDHQWPLNQVFKDYPQHWSVQSSQKHWTIK